jgi:RND family efflux transporter MFP subunit
MEYGIMKSSFSKPKVFAPVLAGLLLASVLVAQEGPPPAAVQVGFALEQEMSPVVWVPGTVVSRNQAAIATEIAGQLTWVAEVGDVVEKGDVVARINDQSLQLQLKNDEATIKRHEANLQYLEQQVNRLERLTEQQVAPANDLEEAVSQRETLVQEIVQAKVAQEQTRYQISRTRVTAPFPGRVVERLQQPGGYASVGGPVVRLVDTENIEVRAQAPLSVESYLQEGMSLAVKGRDQEAKGTLRAAIPVGDERSRMFEVRVALGNVPWIIGSAVRVALPSASPRPVIAVPRDALILRSDSIYLFKVTADGTAEKVAVETGIGHASLIEVKGKVSAGDQVVVRGGERLQPGQSVTIAGSGDEAQPSS